VEFYLVRHGETDWNKQDRIQGWMDVGLNETGRAQARRTAGRLPDVSFDIFSSSLRRASETTDELVSHITVKNRSQYEGFRELNQGHWNGLRGDWVLQHDRNRYETWLSDPINRTPPKGESLEDVRVRVRNGLNRVVRESGGNQILIVAHKVVNSLITHLIADRSLDEVLEKLPDNAQVVSHTVSEDQFPLAE
jgi:broad specificity phosphatase PhoE